MTISYKILEVNDVTQEYVNWFNDPDVIKYSDSQYRSFTIESQRRYVEECANSNHIFLFGIFFQETHIGNVVIDKINDIHLHAEIAYVVGLKSFRGQGVGTDAVNFATQYSKEKLLLNKVYAGVAENNIASIKVLKKCGFMEEGRARKHLHYNGCWQDMLHYSLIF